MKNKFDVKNSNINDNLNNGTIYNHNKEDRLSSLPNTLLIHIISLLPLTSAAITSTLSHHWRHLWTHQPHLLFNSLPLQKPLLFFTTITHILKQLNSPQIQTFNLILPYPNLETHEFQFFVPSLQSWVSQVCSKNPAKILISFDSIFESKHLIPLPTCVFETPSLTHLQLNGKFHCTLPKGGIFNLPNLKKLDLIRVDFDSLVLRTLFKSCPLLESLNLSLYLLDDEVVNISSQNLKFLIISIDGSSKDSNFVIDSPMLEEIMLNGSIAFYRFVQIPIRLRKVGIAFWGDSFLEEDGYYDQIPELLRGISCVKSVSVISNLAVFDTLNYYMDAGVWAHFHNLTDLSLVVTGDLQMNLSAPIPRCLLSKLKKIDLLMEGNDDDVELVEYILSNGSVLEKLDYVFVNYVDEETEGEETVKFQLEKEFKLCRKFFTLPRSSVNCKIRFDGTFICASNDESFNGSIFIESNWRGPQPVAHH